MFNDAKAVCEYCVYWSMYEMKILIHSDRGQNALIRDKLVKLIIYLVNENLSRYSAIIVRCTKSSFMKNFHATSRTLISVTMDRNLLYETCEHIDLSKSYKQSKHKYAQTRYSIFLTISN